MALARESRIVELSKYLHATQFNESLHSGRNLNEDNMRKIPTTITLNENMEL